MRSLMRRAVELDHPADWLARARHDRALPDGEKLFQSVLAENPMDQVSFHFRPRRGVKARDVVQQLHVTGKHYVSGAFLELGGEVNTRVHGLSFRCLTEPPQSYAIVRDGKTDLVMLAHAKLSDPNWPYHAARAPNIDRPHAVLPLQDAYWLKDR